MQMEQPAMPIEGDVAPVERPAPGADHGTLPILVLDRDVLIESVRETARPDGWADAYAVAAAYARRVPGLSRPVSIVDMRLTGTVETRISKRPPDGFPAAAVRLKPAPSGSPR